MTTQHTGTSNARSGKRSSRQRHALAHPKAGSHPSKNHRKRWANDVTQHSDALDIEADIFKSGSAEEIAASLKRSATHSHRRKGTPFQSAMSMLNFYANRAGKNLPKSRRETLQSAKKKLRELFGRVEPAH